MRGVTFKGNREAEIREFPDPHAGPGEAVLRIRASGLCGTDLHRYRDAGPTEMITGHEPCGVIEELGPGAPPGLKLGDRVMCHHYEGCGVCEICSMGYEQLCPHGHVTFGGGTGHGANADYMICPSRTLVHLPEELSFEEGAAISCGTGTAWNGLNKMDVNGKDIVAVFGQGPVGLSGTLSAKAMGARVIAIDVMDERLRLATELGADHTINAASNDPVQAIRDLTGGQGATAALETSGNPTARQQTLTCLRPFARACYVGVGGTGGDRLQPRRYLQGADRLRLVDVQQGGTHRDSPLLRGHQGAAGPADNPPLRPRPGHRSLPNLRRRDYRQVRVRFRLSFDAKTQGRKDFIYFLCVSASLRF